jgi:hypothetical protein
MLIKLLKELDSRSSVVDRFISIYSVASKMLNKIDHIHSNIQNIMNSNKSRPTIFGSLSYFVSNNTMKNASGQKHGIIVCVNFGSLTDKRPDFPAIIPLGKPVANGASLFAFYAFDSIYQSIYYSTTSRYFPTT